MSSWWYEQAGRRVGPITKMDILGLHELGHIDDLTLVWREGMDGWANIRDILDLRSAMYKTEPPPLPPALPPAMLAAVVTLASRKNAEHLPLDGVEGIDAPKASPSTESRASTSTTEQTLPFGSFRYDGTIDNGPQGVRGWLIYLSIALMIGSLLIAVQTWSTIQQLIVSWEVFDTRPALGIFVIIEIFGNIAMITVGLYCLRLLLTKSKKFPPITKRYFVMSIAFIFIDSLVAQLVFNIPLEPKELTATGRGIFNACIWLWYLQVSKRVKNTYGPLAKNGDSL